MKKNIREESLYVILDTAYVASSQLVDVAKKVVDAGCSLIQLRDKESSLSQVLAIGLKIKKVLPPHVIFILNDYVELVQEMGADGVHLGQDDTPVSLARAKLGESTIIGLSTHSYDQALSSKNERVDYIGYGPIFRTKTKPLSAPIGVYDLSLIKQNVFHPVFAIGGLNLTNIDDVMKSGANGITVVSAILESSDFKKTTIDFLKRIRNLKNEQKAYEAKAES